MGDSKIRLSAAEMEMVNDANVILTKNTIIKKATALLITVQEKMQDEISLYSHNNPMFTVPPKISKGENYNGFPYLVLDYPRLADEKGICFVRSMFLWGHFFSSTLHLSGYYQQRQVQKISAAYSTLSINKYSVGVNTDPWQHHFENNNYKAVDSYSIKEFDELLSHHPHIKIATSWPVTHWEKVPDYLVDSWRFLTGLAT
ncbi:MAG: hypothetical protein V4676_06060 [Bacteroidota bacterium]